MGNKCKLIVNTADRVQMWETRLLRLASSSIGWDDMPYTIDTVYLEYLLARNGSAIIVYDSIADVFVCGQNASTGDLDIYGYPVNRSVIFRNGKQLYYTPDTSVIIYNNSMRCGDFWIYRIFANDLANIDMAVRVNINSQKTMPILPVSQQQALSTRNLLQDIDENVPFRMVDPSGMDIEAFKTALQFDNRNSFTSDNMITVQRELWNRALTFIGINNVNVEKKERVNVFETNSNLDEIEVMRRDRINARERAAKELYHKFGIKTKPHYYSDIVNGIGGDGNGKVYNASTYNSGRLLPTGQPNTNPVPGNSNQS